MLGYGLCALLAAETAVALLIVETYDMTYVLPSGPVAAAYYDGPFILKFSPRASVGQDVEQLL